jgi:RND family efflux transporter MFP subunit
MFRPSTEIKLLLTASILTLTAACSSEKPATPESGSAVAVEFASVAPEPIADVWETVGVVRSRTRAELSARMMGDVRRVLVDEGDRVRAGQLLVEIDSRESADGRRKAQGGREEVEHALRGAEAARAAAHANAGLARTTHERYLRLREKNAVSEQEFDEVAARAQAAEAEARRADEALRQLSSRVSQADADVRLAQTFDSYSRITAPFDGVVASRMVEPGQQAAPGMPLLTVEESGRFEVEASVDETMAGRITPGSRARVVLPALGREMTGVVRQVAPSFDAGARSARVKIDLQPDSALQSGLFARVGFDSGVRKAILVAADSVVRRGQLTGVWVVGEGEKAAFRLVTIGKNIGGRVEILSGVDPGERVIVSALDLMREGLALRPAKVATR